MDKFISMIAGAVLMIVGTSTTPILPPVSEVEEEKQTQVATTTVKDLVIAHIEKTFPDDKRLMRKIAECESGGKHFNEDGSVVIGRVTPDVGLFQISPKHWGIKAKKLGFDIYSLEGNILMARHIYDVQGLSAWSASFKNCWAKTD